MTAIRSFIFVWLIALSGCAVTGTTMGGRNPGASTAALEVAASVNYSEPALVPCRLRLFDGLQQQIMIEVPGYKRFQVGVSRTAAGWHWKRINLGDCVIIGVELAGGGAYILNKQQYVEALKHEAVAQETVPNHLHVVVVQESPHEWRRVASLLREG